MVVADDSSLQLQGVGWNNHEHESALTASLFSDRRHSDTDGQSHEQLMAIFIYPDPEPEQVTTAISI
jgi:hypothetical protein